MLPQEESLEMIRKFLATHNIEKVNTIAVDTMGYRKFANRTFAKWTFAIGERPLNLRQYTL